MRLLLKLLRPETIPSPNRKKIPLGTRIQLSLYRSCLMTLRKWYTKYAFSDSVVVMGSPTIRVFHEYRDLAFEAELKRLRMSLPEVMLERGGATSSRPDKRKRRPYYSNFRFEDTFRLDIDGQKVSIDHGDGRSFVATLSGHLKESDSESLIAKYAFSASRRQEHQEKGNATPAKRAGISSSIAGSGPARGPKHEWPTPPSSSNPTGPTPPARKPGALFGDDPLLGRITEKPDKPVDKPSPTIKNVEGVTIDESF